jgi:DNA-binding SARP family transcriptional activator
VLAAAYPRLVSTDRLIDALWSTDDVRDESRLQVVVSRLRRAIGTDVVATVPGGYRLDAPAGSIDVGRFRQHTNRGRQLLTLGRPGQAAEAFRQALAQWRGIALADLRSFDFAEDLGRGLGEERIDVVEWLMDAELQAGDHHLVVSDLAGLVESHPTRERLWYLLMLALYRSGRQAEALRAFRRLREFLVEELGIEPSPEVADLEERILLHDPSLSTPKSVDLADVEWTEEAHLLSFKPGELIVEQGTLANNVYWIEDGEVEVVHPTESGEQVLAHLGKGQYFGELASLLGTARTASVRASSPTTLSVHSVASFRHRLGAARTNSSEDAGSADEVESLVQRGDYLRAYDLASTHIERGQADPQLRWLAVLALAKAGANSLARRKFQALGLGSIDPTALPARLAQDIAALIPRLDKDMALQADETDQRAWAKRSAAGYETAYQQTGSPYLGTNAATMWLVAGDRKRARELALSVLDELDEGSTYWDAVTEAELALVVGEHSRAEAALIRAGAARDSDPAARATTLRQLHMICGRERIESSILEPIRNPSVVHYTGHRVAAPGSVGRFVAEEEDRVARELKETFAEVNVGVGFGSLAAGADILAAEALLDIGAELQVVLPFDRDEFVRASVAPAGSDWLKRFERCLASAADVITVSSAEYLDDPILFDFCAQVAMGDALVRADALNTDAVQVAVWDGKGHGGHAGTEVDVARWRATGNRSVVIGVGQDAPPPAPQASQGKRQIRGLVFADFAGFSTLSDAQVFTFQEVVMGSLAEVVSGFDTQLLSGRTWGDGLHLVFGDVQTAAECAIALQRTVGEMDLAGMGVAGLRGMRVAAHAAPVFDGWDPIGNVRVFYGSGVTKTARIEPRTPEGEVYVTHAFAALAVLAAERSFECSYVGTIQAAKGYGPVTLYSLRRRRGVGRG